MRSMESSPLKCTCITKIEEREQWNNVILKKEYNVWQVIMKLKYTTSYTTITKG